MRHVMYVGGYLAVVEVDDQQWGAHAVTLYGLVSAVGPTFEAVLGLLREGIRFVHENTPRGEPCFN